MTLLLPVSAAILLGMAFSQQPVINAALFFVCMVAGQLLGASIADHFGAFGLPVRPFSIMRFIGLAMVMAGAWFVYKG